MGPSWSHLRALWARLGAPQGHLGSRISRIGPSWSSGPWLRGRCCPRSGAACVNLSSWRPLGPSWAHLGAIGARLGALQGHLGCRIRRIGPTPYLPRTYPVPTPYLPQRISEDLGGLRRTSEDLGGPRRTSEDLGGPRGTSEDLGGPPRTSEDLGGPRRTSEDLEGPQRTSGDFGGPRGNTMLKHNAKTPC